MQSVNNTYGVRKWSYMQELNLKCWLLKAHLWYD